MRRSEKREAKLDGATLVPNSGRGEAKGDARWRGYLVDYKHYAKSYSITDKNWEKMRRDAWCDHHREGLIKVVFDDGTSLAIIDFEWLKHLHEQIDELEKKLGECEASYAG